MKPLGHKQAQALAKAKSALAIIDEQALLPWSEEQEPILREAYDILRWQCSPLGVGIEPMRDGTAEIIFHGVENFKWRLDKRYPGWQSWQPTLTDTVVDTNDASTIEEDLREEALEERIITGSDCRCTNHFGPHWLYQDYQWYERNLKILERCARHVQGLYEWGLVRDQDPTASSRGRQQRQGAELAYRAFALEEIPRLREKIYLMTSLHIESISYDMLGPAFEDLSAREHAILARNIELFQKIAGKAVVS